MVLVGSVVVLVGLVVLLTGLVATARRRATRPWPPLLAAVGVVVVLAGLLVRASVHHEDVCSYASHRCARSDDSGSSTGP